MIKLEKLTWDNWKACLNLEVTKEQDHFVASNVYTLAHSFIALSNDDLPPITLAITQGGKVIGLTMIFYITSEKNDYGDEPAYDICRFMIDKSYQGKGYGREAFKQVLDLIRTHPQGPSNHVYLSYEPENSVAKKMYETFGFLETGDKNHRQSIARKTL